MKRRVSVGRFHLAPRIGMTEVLRADAAPSVRSGAFSAFRRPLILSSRARRVNGENLVA